MYWKNLLRLELRNVGSARRLVLLLLVLLAVNLGAATILHLSHRMEHTLELEDLDAIARSRAASQRIALLASRLDAEHPTEHEDVLRQRIRALAAEIESAEELTLTSSNEVPSPVLSYVELARRLAAAPWAGSALATGLADELIASAEPTLEALDHLVRLRREELLDEYRSLRRVAWLSFFALTGLVLLSHLVLLFPLLRRIESGSQELARRFHSTQRTYRSTFEDHPLPILVVDAASRRLLDVNAAAVKQYGWTRDELLEMRLDDLRSEPVGEDEVFDSDGIPSGSQGTWAQRRKDGTVFHAEFFCSPKNSGSSRIAVVADVTDREKARRHIEWEQAWFEGIAENLAEGVVVSDLDGLIAYCNNGVAEITGFRRESLVGRRLHEFVSDGEGLQQRLERRAQGESETYLESVLCAGGKTIQVEIHSSPLRDVDGTIYGSVSAFSDVTERIEVEEQLRRREGELSTVFRQIPARLWSTDLDLRVTSLSGRNPGLGHQADELVGRTVGDMVAEDLLPWDALAVHQRAVVGEAGTYLSDFGATVFRSRVEPLRDARGQIVGTIGVGLDVTEVVEAQRERDLLDEQLHQAQKMESIGRLAGGVAHDFNNLLSAILGWAELLEARMDPREGREEIQEIVSAARTAGSVSRQLLAFSRQDACDPQLLVLNDAICDVEKLLRRVIGEDVELLVDCSDDVGRVVIDPIQLQQILLNLAVNARDAMPDGGRLEIRTRRTTSGNGEWFEIAVRDSGVGMDEEVQKRLFEPFFTTKKRGHGTGLGLSTVLGIVEQNGGRVTVESHADEGTVFYVVLPEAERHDRAVIATKAGVETVPFGCRILLVEDEAALRTPLCRGMRKRGFEVFGAADADEAIRIFEAQGPETFQLLITDVVMPGRFGDELASELLKSNPNLRVLFISGYSQDRLRGRRHGRPVLTKPFGLNDVQEKILATLSEQVADSSLEGSDSSDVLSNSQQRLTVN